MLFEKPTKKVPTNNGSTEKYLLEDENLRVYVNTILGGYEYAERNNDKKISFVLRGFGEAVRTIDRETKKEEVFAILNEGDLYEIPTVSDLKLRGQLKHLQFAGAENVEQNNITKELKFFPAVDTTTLLYIVDGLGNYKTQDSKYTVLRDGYLLEIPAGTEFELKGTLHYIIAR